MSHLRKLMLGALLVVVALYHFNSFGTSAAQRASSPQLQQPAPAAPNSPNGATQTFGNTTPINININDDATAGITTPQSAAPSATITVNSLLDVQANNGQCTLREALINANNDNQSGSTDCTAGSGADTITFSVNGTINLTAVLPTISGSLTITGPGANLLTVKRNTGGDYRIFLILQTTLTINISGLTISNGKAAPGAGIFSLSNLTLTNCAVINNQVFDNQGGGGVFLNNANGTFTGCTFSGNTAGRYGGAIYKTEFTGGGGHTLTLTNCTFSGNTATGDGYGGAVANDSPSGLSTLAVTNCTFAYNVGANGSAIATLTTSAGATATTTLLNTLLAHNTGQSLQKFALNGGGAATLTSLGNNLASDNPNDGSNIFLNQPGDKRSANPQITPLGYYGGGTQTHALLVSSPAVDAGTSTGAPANDQRGLARGGDGNGYGATAYDIGAYELRSKFINVNTGNDANNGLSLATPWQTIAFGIATATAGDDLIIAGGTYFESNLTVSKNINFQGESATTTIVNANTPRRVFTIESPFTVGMANMTITGGNATGGPGGGINNAGTLSLTHCVVTNNMAGSGGGINSGGLLTISYSTISANQSQGIGSGIYQSGSAITIAHSTISNNTVNSPLSGIWLVETMAVLTNVTISGNTGNRYAGIYHGVTSGSGSLLLTNCTIADNQSDGSSGAIHTVSNSGGTIVTQLKNTIVADNAGPSLTVGGANASVVSLGNNLATDNGGGFLLTGAGDLLNTSPNLTLLQDFGGPTKTHNLNIGSPAINAGSNTGVPLTDQRGINRQIGTNVDIGAVETTFGISCPTLTINPATLPPGTVSQFYGQSLTVSGGAPPYIFNVAPGNTLPPGLSLSSIGLLAGYATTEGTYNFDINVYDQNGCSNVRSYTITIAEAGCTGTAAIPIAIGQTLTGQLLPGDCTFSIDNSRYDWYRFNGVAGQGIAFALNSSDFDAYLFLYSSSFTFLAGNDNGGGGTNARIPATSGFYTLPTTGTYYIRANSFTTSGSGNYGLSLSGCPVTLAPTSANFGAAATSSSLAVTAACPWGAVSNAAWLTLTGATTGAGNGTVNYNVAANTGASRTGTITVNGQTFTVFQAANNTTQDSDGDGIPDSVEITENRNPLVKDNDIFTNNRLFVMQQYRDFLGREGDPGGITNWVNNLNANALTRAQVIESFFNSAEFQNTGAPIVRLYFACFLRIPDYAGLQNWINAYRGGMTLDAIANAFVTSPEFLQTYGSLNNTQFVTLVYNNVLGRQPDPTGLNNWVNALNNGMSRGTLMVNFSESQEYKNRIGNSVYVTMMYVGMLRRSPDQTGFNNWVAYLNQGNSGLNLINQFIVAQEYRNRFLP